MRFIRAVPVRFYRAMAIAAGLGLAGVAFGQTYYVSPTGSDTNSGTSASSPWQSLNKVDTTTFAPGSQILFQDGGNWYGQQLIASSSGTTSAPITYGNYSVPGGTGAAPTFWGSVPVAPSAFTPIAGTTAYFEPSATAVGSFFVNHQFTNNAEPFTGTAADSANISYVESTPNTCYYGGTGAQQGLYVNTGGELSGSNTYTQAVTSSVVSSNSRSNVKFQGLNVRETAGIHEGFGFYLYGGSNVQVLSSSASATGMHAFAAEDTTNFLGQGLSASYAMPNQGFGGESAYVSYSDYNFSNTTYTWINDTSTNPNGPYRAFYTHAHPSTADPTPIASVVVKNMVAIGGTGIAADAFGNEQVSISGATVSGGSITLYGSNETLNGALVSGPGASVQLLGNNDVVENTIINGATPIWKDGQYGAIDNAGANNTIRYNTIAMGIPTATTPQDLQYLESLEPAIGLQTAATGTQIYANIIDTPLVALLLPSPDTTDFSASGNLVYADGQAPAVIFLNESPSLFFGGLSGSVSYGELLGNPDFLNAANGNFRLSPNSIAAFVFDPTTGQYVPYDFYGNARPLTNGSLGAIEVPEPGVGPLGFLAALALMLVPRVRA